MISVTGATGNYILQPALMEKHKLTLDWLSNTLLWKSELHFFQKLLDERAPLFTSVAEKKKIDHFQNLIIYYNGEVVDGLRKKLRDHESKLAKILETKNESDIAYYKEHDVILDELETFSNLFKEFRNDFLRFIEKTNDLPDQAR